VLERLRPRLRVFHDEGTRELFDLPNGKRPDPDTPAPARFLPEYDNSLLGYKGRTRMIDADDRRLLDAPILGNFRTFLVDGRVAGRWKITREGDAAALAIDPVVRLSRAEVDDLADEGARLLAFLAGDAGTRDVRIGRPRAGTR
jgi:Winged helix DNA-binding domain